MKNKSKGKPKHYLWLAIAVAIPALIGGLRYKVGTDYNSYVQKATDLSSIGLNEYISSYINIFEPTFYLLSKITLPSSDQAILFFTLTSFITVLFFLLASIRYSTKYAWLIYFASLITLYPKTLNGIRQGIAAAIIFYAISYIPKRKPIKYILLVLLASLFHYSSLMMLPVYLIYLIPNFNTHWIKDRYAIIKNIAITAFGYLSVVLLVRNITHIPFFGRYAYLVSPATASVPITSIAMKALPIVLVVPFYKRLVGLDPKYGFYVLLCMLAVVLTAIGYYVDTGYRLSQYFMLFYIVLFAGVARLHENSRFYRVVLIAIVAYCMLYFIGSFYLQGSHDVIPYQFIF